MPLPTATTSAADAVMIEATTGASTAPIPSRRADDPAQRRDVCAQRPGNGQDAESVQPVDRRILEEDGQMAENPVIRKFGAASRSGAVAPSAEQLQTWYEAPAYTGPRP